MLRSFRSRRTGGLRRQGPDDRQGLLSLPPGSDDGDAIYVTKKRRHRNRYLKLQFYDYARQLAAIIVSLILLCLSGFVGWRLGTYIESEVGPNSWKTWGFNDFRIIYGCDDLPNNGTATLPNNEYWQVLRDAYIAQVDNEYKFDDPIPPTRGYTLNEDGAPPFYAAMAPGKGRGLFASRDIKKGELVHDGTKGDVTFPDAMSFRRYLHALPTATHKCDVMQWCWTQKLEAGGPHVLLCELNIASLMNGGGWGGDDNINVGPNNSTSRLFYAKKDIEKGKEILMNYGMGSQAEWAAVGLGRRN